MFAEFIHTLKRTRGSIIGWSIGLGLYGLFMVSFFSTMQGIEGIEELLASYPPEMLAFFGDSIQAITTPMGYIDTYYFVYMPVIVGIFAVGIGANLLAGDEEKGILDLVLAHPVTRPGLFWGRVLASVVATLIILLFSWLSWAIPSGNSGMDVSWGELLLPFFPLLAILLLTMAVALFLSMALPAARLASMLTGSLLVANFLLVGLANLNDNLASVIKITPLHYYQGGKAMEGLNGNWLLGLLTVAALFTLAAWQLFERRDIRVGGERGWQWANWFPTLTKREKVAN